MKNWLLAILVVASVCLCASVADATDYAGRNFRFRNRVRVVNVVNYGGYGYNGAGFYGAGYGACGCDPVALGYGGYGAGYGAGGCGAGYGLGVGSYDYGGYNQVFVVRDRFGRNFRGVHR